MSNVYQRLSEQGWILPPELVPPAGVVLPAFGPYIGAHSRSAVGLAELPFDIAVEIEAEVEIH